MVYDAPWRERLHACTRLAPPAELAQAVALGLARGEEPREIAKAILPAVEGVRAGARRVARTEALRVAQAAQMRCHQALGDLVVGYQVNATLDQHTRPWHAARDGTVYHASPAGGEKGYGQMPNPPDEAADPLERPPGAPQTAWNCRCFLVPVLRPEGAPVTPATP